MTITLTETEIRDLTGRQVHHAQARVLVAMGIEHRRRPDGSIAVLRDHVIAVLSGGKPAHTTRRVEPNWGALAKA